MRKAQRIQLMTEALELIVTALGLLDEVDAPADIGAHIDLGRDRLCRTLELTANDPVGVPIFPRPAA